MKKSDNELIPKPLCVEDYKFIKLLPNSKRPKDPAFNTDPAVQYRYDELELLEWIKSGGNYGILCHGLVIIDLDTASSKIATLRNILDRYETFKVTTGSGNQHYYFKTDISGTKKLYENDKAIGDMKASGQVVCPRSIHPNGNQYLPLNDNDIIKIDKDELLMILNTFFKKPTTSTPQRCGGGGGVEISKFDYQTETLEIDRALQVLEQNPIVNAKFRSRTKPSDRSAVDFIISKCLIENKINTRTIIEILNRYNFSKVHTHKDGTNYALRTIMKARERENQYRSYYGHNNDKNVTAMPLRAVGGDNRMANVTYEIVGEPNTIDKGFGEFIEISEKVRKESGKNDQHFISMSRGRFGLDEHGNKDETQKRYEKNFTLPKNGHLKEIVDVLSKYL